MKTYKSWVVLLMFSLFVPCPSRVFAEETEAVESPSDVRVDSVDEPGEEDFSFLGRYVDREKGELTKTPTGNRQMFSPKPRTLVLPEGSEVAVPGAALLVVLICGAWVILHERIFFQSCAFYAGVAAFYSGWVHHKWVIAGNTEIATGHLASAGIGIVGLFVGTFGAIWLIRAFKQSGKTIWSPLLIFHAAFLGIGLFTGTAIIFEAGPALFGLDMALECLAVMIAFGSAVTTSAALVFMRGVARVC